MTRSTRQRIFFFLLLMLAFFIKTRLDRFEDNLLKNAQARAKQQNIDLTWQSAAVSLSGKATAQGLQLLYSTPLGRLPLKVDDLNLHFSWLSFLTLKLAAQLDAQLYAGQILADFEQPLFDNAPAGNFSVTKLKIENYPAANLWGVSGLLSANGTFNSTHAQSDLKLENGTFNTATLGGGLLKLSPVSEIEATAKIDANPKQMKIEEIEFNSSHGSARGRGELILKGRNIQGGSINLAIVLSELGTTELAPYLALIGNLPPDTLIQNWTLKIDFAPGGRASVQIRPTT